MSAAAGAPTCSKPGHRHLAGPAGVACFEQVGMCFMFAQGYHASMKHAAGPRRSGGARCSTCWDALNPAFVPYMLLAPAKGGWRCCWRGAQPAGHPPRPVGIRTAWTRSRSARRRPCAVNRGRLECYVIEPSQFGLKTARPGDVRGGDAKENAGHILFVLKGNAGPRRDIVLMNAGAALYAAQKAASIDEGIALAKRAIDSGAALAKFEEYRRVTQRLAETVA